MANENYRKGGCQMDGQPVPLRLRPIVFIFLKACCLLIWPRLTYSCTKAFYSQFALLLKNCFYVNLSTGWFLPNKALKGFVHYDSRCFDFFYPRVFHNPTPKRIETT
jgi:hypothetical protein